MQLDLDLARQSGAPLGMHGQAHRFVERGGDDPAVRDARGALVILLHEESPGHSITGALQLQLESEQVRLPAAEAEVVVAEAGQAPFPGRSIRP